MENGTARDAVSPEIKVDKRPVETAMSSSSFCVSKGIEFLCEMPEF